MIPIMCPFPRAVDGRSSTSYGVEMIYTGLKELNDLLQFIERGQEPYRTANGFAFPTQMILLMIQN